MTDEYRDVFDRPLKVCTLLEQPPKHVAGPSAAIHHELVEARIKVLSDRYDRGEPLFRPGEKFPPEEETRMRGLNDESGFTGAEDF